MHPKTASLWNSAFERQGKEDLRAALSHKSRHIIEARQGNVGQMYLNQHANQALREEFRQQANEAMRNEPKGVPDL